MDFKGTLFFEVFIGHDVLLFSSMKDSKSSIPPTLFNPFKHHSNDSVMIKYSLSKDEKAKALQAKSPTDFNNNNNDGKLSSPKTLSKTIQRSCTICSVKNEKRPGMCVLPLLNF